jgi:acyl-CoA synthetase (AMP-forming)/AMP-acid ligase II
MIFHSPFENVEIPEVPLTKLVLQRASELGDKAALIEGPTGRTISYAQLADSINRAAFGLSKRGFRKGDVAGILSPNVPEYAIAFHALASLGGIVTTINPLYTADEIARQLNDSAATLLFTYPSFIEKAREAATTSRVKELFVFGEAEGATPFNELLQSNGAVPDVSIDPRTDLIALPYSSGTTGLPKGVMLTHYNLVANLKQMEGLDYFFESDTLICVLPLFHIYGLVVILNMGLHAGATIVMMPRFELEDFLRMVRDYQVSLAHLVPPIVLALSKSPIVDQYKLPKLKTIFSGAAPLGEELTRDCMQRLNCNIRQGYGMTETSPVTHSTPAAPEKTKFGSIGVPAPSTECKIVDLGTGVALGPRQEGEICVRGPQVMKGYLNRPEATAQTIDSDGWLHTGDIGFADEDGHFFVVDRAKELIKYKGFQVPPAELEAILLTHPSIADAAVIPCPDVEAGELPKAYVVLRTGAEGDGILEFVAERVAPHKRIRLLEFIDKIPKSPSGKILRRVLIERERARTRAE